MQLIRFQACLATLATVCIAAAGLCSVASAQAATYVVEPTHTSVIWEAKHFGVSTSRGRFDKKAGTIVFDQAAKTGSVEITIDMKSINTGVAPFDAHLKSDDFFAAEKFPEAKFVSTRLKFDGDKIAEVVGQLTLRGVTKPVVLKATSFGCYENPKLKRQVCGGDFETTLVRSEFGMNYGLPGIPDNVRLLIQIEAVAQ